MDSRKVWFITGSSTGFGREMTEYVLNKGERVVATLRKLSALDDLKSKYSPSDLLVVKLDVTKEQEVADAFNAAKQAFGRIDVVFNNAGFGLQAEVEAAPYDLARAMFETNFWGSTTVSREAVKFFREVNGRESGGRLLVNSSLAGIAGTPAYGYYSASKFALEGITETLAKELDPEWNIKVTIIEPGAFETKATDNIIKVPVHPAYTKPTLPSNAVREFFDKLDPSLLANAAQGVKIIYKLTELSNPPLRFALGKDSNALMKEHCSQVVEDIKAYESWSEELSGDFKM